MNIWKKKKMKTNYILEKKMKDQVDRFKINS
jgi:hypothetical protein